MPRAKAKQAKPPLRLEWVEARTLKANPANWRRHPQGQLSALKHLINDKHVGWAGALLYNEHTRQLIDGHGRMEVVRPTDVVPVLIGSWSPEAEKKILATLDPLAAMATTDEDQLSALLDDVDLADDALAALQAQLDRQLGDDGDDEETAKGGHGGGERKERTLSESYVIIATCEDEAQQQEVFDLLKERGIKCRVNTGF